MKRFRSYDDFIKVNEGMSGEQEGYPDSEDNSNQSGGFVKVKSFRIIPSYPKKLAKKLIREIEANIEEFRDIIEDCRKENIGFQESPEPRPALIEFNKRVIEFFPDYADVINEPYFIKYHMFLPDSITWNWSIFKEIYGTLVSRKR